MFAVFAAFVPDGEGPIKTIAFGLAVGVFIDAFVVRMTLVPAVLALLGRAAWWLPRWIDRRLPSFDVEGEALTHQLALADWPAPGETTPGLRRGRRPVGGTPASLAVRPGEVAVVDLGRDASALLLTLSGRMAIARWPGQGRRPGAARAGGRGPAAYGVRGLRGNDLTSDSRAGRAILRAVHPRDHAYVRPRATWSRWPPSTWPSAAPSRCRARRTRPGAARPDAPPQPLTRCCTPAGPSCPRGT